MPQVYFSTETFSGREVLPDYVKYIDRLIKEGHGWLRYIDNPYNLHKVEGFEEAAKEGFEGFIVHHRAGRYAKIGELIIKGLYHRQPPCFLRFMRNIEHVKMHALISALHEYSA